MSKRERVGYREGRHVKQAIQQETEEKGPERIACGSCEEGDGPDEVTKCQEFFGRKIAIGELVAKENSD